MLSPAASVTRSDTSTATGVKVSEKTDSEDIEGDGLKTDHCNRLLSWERDVARGSKAIRGPTLYAAENLSVELAEIEGLFSCITRVRFYLQE